jgi:hypothetical protein
MSIICEITEVVMKCVSGIFMLIIPIRVVTYLVFRKARELPFQHTSWEIPPSNAKFMADRYGTYLENQSIFRAKSKGKNNLDMFKTHDK